MTALSCTTQCPSDRTLQGRSSLSGTRPGTPSTRVAHPMSWESKPNPSEDVPSSSYLQRASICTLGTRQVQIWPESVRRDTQNRPCRHPGRTDSG